MSINKKLTGLWLLMIALSACGSDDNKADQPTSNTGPRHIDIGASADAAIVASLPFSERSFLMGTAGFVPAHFSAAPGESSSSLEDWQYFFDRGAALYGGLFGVHVSANEDKINASSNVLDQAKTAYETVKLVTPYLAIGYAHHEGPFTITMGDNLIKVARDTAAQYKPVFLSIGVELNSFYLHQNATYDLYVQYAIQAIQAVKTASPNTLVMTNFQLDQMKGEASLTGINEPSHWELIDDFEDHVDGFSFTAYPYLEYTQVTSIPNDYLSEIRDHTDLPVIITETGWPSVNLVTGVQGSEQAQIDYLLKLGGFANDIDLQALMWVLPHDANFNEAGGVFDNISLFTNDDQEKPAYEYWKAIHSLPDTSDLNL